MGDLRPSGGIRVAGGIRAAGRAVRRLRVDGFILAILTTVAIAALVPARGVAVEWVDHATTVGIALLFFLYGARLAPREALTGLTHWRLHLLILGFTFLAFPLIGLALRGVGIGHLLGPELANGLVFLTLVPSTVQSSIAFTGLARGNVPGAIVSASTSNLLGVFITPLLVLMFMSTDGGISFSAGTLGTIGGQLLAPFIVGQLCRPLIGSWVQSNSSWLKYVDRSSIILVVYSAFSEGVREGMWSLVNPQKVLALIAISVALVLGMLWLTKASALRIGLSEADAIAVQFCGTKKSLATGLPMAAALFAGHPVGLLVLPLMIFHQVQLMICAQVAAKYARKANLADGRSGSAP